MVSERDSDDFLEKKFIISTYFVILEKNLKRMRIFSKKLKAEYCTSVIDKKATYLIGKGGEEAYRKETAHLAD